MNAPVSFLAGLPRAFVEAALDALKTQHREFDATPDAAQVPWTEVAHFLDGLAPRLSDEAARRFAVQYLGQHHLLRLAAPLGLSQRGFAELLGRYVRTLQPVLFEVEASLGEVLEVRAALRAGLAPSETWWRLLALTWTHAPTAVGLAPLKVLSQQVTGRELRVRWAVPPPQAHAARSAAVEALSAHVPLLAGCETVALEPEREEVQLQRDLGLTPAETRVALCVTDGLTAREASRALGVAYETVRTHLRNINERLELSSQRELAFLVERWRTARAGASAFVSGSAATSAT